MITCVVRGSGDIGAAIARSLLLCGHRVAIHDIPAPSYHRRASAYVDALFEGHASVEGVVAQFARGPAQLASLTLEQGLIAVTTLDLGDVLEELQPDVLVDARMRKREVPERQRGLAPFTVGAGPNFVAGETTDVAIETAWGEALGRVIHAGPTRAFGGEPRMVAGHGRERFVYALAAGVVLGTVRIGERVLPGDVMGRIGDSWLRAPIGGVVAGLTRTGVPVRPGSKVAEVDPRGDPRLPLRIGERALGIAAGVQAAVEEFVASLGEPEARRGTRRDSTAWRDSR